MLFIHGHWNVRRHLGYVADRCPQCDAIQLCRLYETARTETVYGLPTSNRGAAEHEAKCLGCSCIFSVNGLHYHALCRNKKAPIEDIISLTSPWLRARSPAEKAGESRFRQILAPFVRYDAVYRDRGQGGMQIDWRGGMAFLTALVIPFVVAGLSMSGALPFLPESEGIGIALLLAGPLLAWGVFVFLGENRRYYRRQIMPLIAAQLDPLDPEPWEIDAAIRRLRTFRFPSAKLIKPGKLVFAPGPVRVVVAGTGFEMPDGTSP